MFQNNARPDNPRLLRAVGAGVVLGAALVGGCSVMPPVSQTTRQANSRAVSARETAAETAPNARAAAARSRSLERAVAGVNAETVRAWVNRYTAPAGETPAASGEREVFISVEALARRHAAWQLADKLQADAIAPTEARPLKVEVPALRAPIADKAPSRIPIPAVGALPVRPARSVSATISQRAAITASRATLDDFLSDLRARQNDLEAAESELARRALEDRIRAATRGAVEAISLAPVSPETALELSNLRLQLLAQLNAPPAKRAEAIAKIETIEKRLNQIWERQTQEQNARLRAAFEELPARLRREGLDALSGAATERESQRYYARLELRSLIENRLNDAQPSASDTQMLRLLLPAARVATPNLSAPRNSSSQTNARRAASNRFQTKNELRDNRNAGRDIENARSLSRAAPFDGALIAQLRAQARRDARQWADNLALSWNARLSSATGAPDRTALALQKLFEVKNAA